MNKRRVIILGAGFAGLQLARRIKDAAYEIILIDQYNFHQFQPLFYQVATARLEPSAISFPLRKVFQGEKSLHVRVACVNEIDTTQQIVKTTEGDFEYDILVLATGCTTNFFGNKNIEAHAFPMKSTVEAIALRNRILLNFEDALNAGPGDIDSIMNIVVAGGGPTGVELAGAIKELAVDVIPRDFRVADTRRARVILIEAGPRLLPALEPASSERALKQLQALFQPPVRTILIVTGTVCQSQFSDHVLGSWRRHQTSLLRGLEPDSVDDTEVPA